MQGYHGSDERIERFEAGISESVGVVAYFAIEPYYATKFGEVIIEVELNVSNPLDLRNECYPNGLPLSRWVRVLAEAGIDTDRLDLDRSECMPDLDDSDSLFFWSLLDSRAGVVGHSSNLVTLIREAGYDAILAVEEGSDVVAVFEENQVRVA